jgi:BolA protein
MMIRDEIIERLKLVFPNSSLEVIDESYKHKGHVGYGNMGESHFKIIINDESFKELSAIKVHRAIYSALGDIMSKVHAVSIEIK